jgi:hypothetical protein
MQGTLRTDAQPCSQPSKHLASSLCRLLQEQREREEREKGDRRTWIMQYMENSSEEEGSEAGSEQVRVMMCRVGKAYRVGVGHFKKLCKL